MHHMGNEPLHVRKGRNFGHITAWKFSSEIFLLSFFMVFIAINKTLCLEQNDHWLMSISYFKLFVRNKYWWWWYLNNKWLVNADFTDTTIGWLKITYFISMDEFRYTNHNNFKTHGFQKYHSFIQVT